MSPRDNWPREPERLKEVCEKLNDEIVDLRDKRSRLEIQRVVVDLDLEELETKTKGRGNNDGRFERSGLQRKWEDINREVSLLNDKIKAKRKEIQENKEEIPKYTLPLQFDNRPPRGSPAPVRQSGGGRRRDRQQ